MLSRSRTDPLAAPFFSLLLSDGTKVISDILPGESEPLVTAVFCSFWHR
jgi:hypothetical protein